MRVSPILVKFCYHKYQGGGGVELVQVYLSDEFEYPASTISMATELIVIPTLAFLMYKARYV